ncbi:MAG: acyltransferase [Elainellaceae cyanobacterium]
MKSIELIKQGISNPIGFLGRCLTFVDKGLNKLKGAGLLSTFKSVGPGSAIDYPAKVYGARHISLGKNAFISWNTWIYCVEEYGKQKFNPQLILDDKVYLGPGCHVVTCRKIHIEPHVMLGNNCYISDNLHDYSDVDMPIDNGPLSVPGKIVIGAGSWLGDNVCVFGDLRIGKHCVVGANSVVNRSLPDYSIAVGAPAKIIKRYDFRTGEWRRTDKHGNFLNAEFRVA